MVYSTDRSKAVVPVLVVHFVALLLILRGDRFQVLPCVILFLCFSVLLALRLPRLEELILVLFVRLFDLRLFGFVYFSSSGVWEGLRLVIVALPGLFSYKFFMRLFFYHCLVLICYFVGIVERLCFVFVTNPNLLPLLIFTASGRK